MAKTKQKKSIVKKSDTKPISHMKEYRLIFTVLVTVLGILLTPVHVIIPSDK